MTGLPQHSKKTVEWYTPREIIESARNVMGQIDLDPASNQAAQGIINAVKFLSKEGLEQPWSGRVFLNPPGGDAPFGSPTRSNAALWWSKLSHDYAAGMIEQAVFVGFSIEILQSAQHLVCDQPLDFPFCVFRERIKFLDSRTLVASRMPAHANIVVYLPNRDDNGSKVRFRREFFKYGRILNV